MVEKQDNELRNVINKSSTRLNSLSGGANTTESQENKDKTETIFDYPVLNDLFVKLDPIMKAEITIGKNTKGKVSNVFVKSLNKYWETISTKWDDYLDRYLDNTKIDNSSEVMKGFKSVFDINDSNFSRQSIVDFVETIAVANNPTGEGSTESYLRDTFDNDEDKIQKLLSILFLEMPSS